MNPIRMLRRAHALPLFFLAFAVSALLMGGIPGMATAQTAPYPPPGYSHRVDSSQVSLFWNCARPEGGLAQIVGIAANPWSTQPVQFLALELVGVDARGYSVSEAKTSAPDIQLNTNQSTPFQIAVRIAGTEARFDLYYEYRFQDRGHSPRLSRIAWTDPFMLAQGMTRFLVRDACSETQHLNR
jgi:hypothetical protein